MNECLCFCKNIVVKTLHLNFDKKQQPQLFLYLAFPCFTAFVHYCSSIGVTVYIDDYNRLIIARYIFRNIKNIVWFVIWIIWYYTFWYFFLRFLSLIHSVWIKAISYYLAVCFCTVWSKHSNLSLFLLFTRSVQTPAFANSHIANVVCIHTWCTEKRWTTRDFYSWVTNWCQVLQNDQSHVHIL